MHKLRIVLSAATSIVFVLPVSALPLVPDAKHEIQEALRKADDSLQRKDIAGCMARCTSDFQGGDTRGNHYDRAQAKQTLLKLFSSTQSIEVKTTLKSLAFVHDNAVVLCQQHTKLTTSEKGTHRLHTLVSDELWQGVMVRTKTGWQTKREKSLTSTTTVDGVVEAAEPTSSK